MAKEHSSNTEPAFHIHTPSPEWSMGTWASPAEVTLPHNGKEAIFSNNLPHMSILMSTFGINIYVSAMKIKKTPKNQTQKPETNTENI